MDLNAGIEAFAGEVCADEGGDFREVEGVEVRHGVDLARGKRSVRERKRVELFFAVLL